jgi:hypothetical protein
VFLGEILGTKGTQGILRTIRHSHGKIIIEALKLRGTTPNPSFGGARGGSFQLQYKTISSDGVATNIVRVFFGCLLQVFL